jgi:hypothetical protein
MTNQFINVHNLYFRKPRSGRVNKLNDAPRHHSSFHAKKLIKHIYVNSSTYSQVEVK